MYKIAFIHFIQVIDTHSIQLTKLFNTCKIENKINNMSCLHKTDLKSQNRLIDIFNNSLTMKET